ncbi:MAG: isoleucine--tRNA ligase [Anaerolineales bacterium]
MPFKEVPNRIDFPSLEREILEFWDKSDAFNKLFEIHKDDPPWSFIDGPITANNPMGVHHGWGRTYKDLFMRYWTMRGRKLRYQNGFDCQGLWVEVEVEKEKGFKSKKDIEDYGLEKFVLECKARVLRYAAVQTEQSIRLGYWMDWNDTKQLRELAKMLLNDPSLVITVEGPNGEVTDSVEQIVGRLGLPELGGSYFTFSNENNYMIWKFLKICWENGWLYRGADVMPWCPRCATGISQHEIVTDGYVELTHPSVTLRFPLRGRERESLLVWTTTPWTLTSNVAAAVGPELEYVKVQQGEEYYYLSKGTLYMLDGDYEIIDQLKGAEMEGWTYDGPFDDLPAANIPGGLSLMKKLIKDVEETAAQAHQVILWEEVGETEGTGIVHIAPGCGAEDFELGKEHKFPIIAPLDEEGFFVEGFDWITGQNVAEIAEPIFKDLDRKGILYKVRDYLHRYPRCWRCATELIFRLVDEWFVSMGEVYDQPRSELTSEQKERSLRYQIMDVVDQIRWIPEFGYSREMDWLHNMHDWMISKKRYWGLALPIWICENCGAHEVIGDEFELQERAVEGWEAFAGHTPHRPFIDYVKIKCPECDGLMTRIPDVGNPWLDAGIVSFSTLRYRKDREYWRTWYPADWISESFPGQFRNWFYSMLAMGTVIDKSPSFLENFSYATLLAEDGRPMHKSWGNSIEFNEAADQMGVDVMRWLYCAHKPENDLLFGYNRGDETRRRFLIPLWNVYSFLVTYANIDNWTPISDTRGAEQEQVFDPFHPYEQTPQSKNLLDVWILARINQIIPVVTHALENSDPFSATTELETFLDDLSNWYIRRSRRRFWKSEHDEDKNTAYATLYHVLLKFIRMLAPFIPFVTDSMYQNLVTSFYKNALTSVHHTLWPKDDQSAVDENLLKQMSLSRQIASLGLSARNSAGLKVRQPLARVLVYTGEKQELEQDFQEIIKDELNVKEFDFVSRATDLVTFRILPDNKMLGPKYGPKLPKIQTALGLLNQSSVAESVSANIPVAIEVDGESLDLFPEEIQVSTIPLEGMAVAADKLVTVAVDARITQDLRDEGLAREIVRRIQAMRKNADFNIEDRIVTSYQSSAEIDRIFQTWEKYIKSETLSTDIVPSPPPQDAYFEDINIGEFEIRIGLRKVNQLNEG